MIVYKLWAMGLHLVRFARCLAPAVAFVSITGLAHARTRERAGLIGGISLGAGTVRFGGSTSDPSVATIRQTDDPGADLAANL